MAERVGLIWHVEDSEEWRERVTNLLQEEGHHVLSTLSATEARSLIPDKITGINVAILDGDLGDGTGEELATLIRANQLHIGIIGLSGLPKSLSSWADINLRKGLFDSQELIHSVNNLITASRLSRYPDE